MLGKDHRCRGVREVAESNADTQGGDDHDHVVFAFHVDKLR